MLICISLTITVPKNLPAQFSLRIIKLNNMKKILFLTATAGSILLFSCNNEQKNAAGNAMKDTIPVSVVAQTADTSGTSSMLNAEQVPDTIRTSFMMKYPKAMKPVWIKYTPEADDDMNMDATYYNVHFMNNGEDVTAWYDNYGAWVKTSTRIPGDSRLPDPVNKTLNAMYPGYKIDEIEKENDKDMDMYKIKIFKGDNKVKLKILPNGEVFKRKVK